MDDTEAKLDRWLDSYKVQDADDALLDCILLQARETKIMPFPKRTISQPHWLKNASLVAATALCGFWLGNISLETTTASATSNSINYDTVILGPQTMQEVML